VRQKREDSAEAMLAGTLFDILAQRSGGRRLALMQQLPGGDTGFERPADEAPVLGVRRERQQSLRGDGRVLSCIPVEARERNIDRKDLSSS
jgi:hypothetical protein